MQVTQNKPASAKERLSSHIAFRVVLAVGAAGLEDVGDNAPRACAPRPPASASFIPRAAPATALILAASQFRVQQKDGCLLSQRPGKV